MLTYMLTYADVWVREYLSKRLDDERVKRFAADKENSQTKMSLRAAERELQQEKRMRAGAQFTYCTST